MAVGEGNAGLAFHASEGIFGDIPKSLVASTAVTVAGASAQIPSCPNGCKSGKIVHAGFRRNRDKSVTQRWKCTCCCKRFSNNVLNTSICLASTRQICAEGAKNLQMPHRRYVGTGEVTAEVNAVITVFEGWLRTQGYKKNKYPDNLRTIVRLGADLMNPEDVKEKIGAHDVEDGMKMQLCYSYNAFVDMNKKTLSWEMPTGYKQAEIIPFIPERTELDQLIAATQSRRMAAFLQTLDDTFTDPGEALLINRDEDIKGNAITIRHPVKDHRPRTLEVSQKCIAMINMLPPTDSGLVFDCTYNSIASTFLALKRRVAEFTKNDRFNFIELRSYRHYAGTRIAELSNGNPMTVMKFLGLKSVDNAMKYVNIWKLSFKTETEYDMLEVTTPEDLKRALLGGYTHVIDKFGASWFRRPKRIAFAGTPISQRPDELQCPTLETPINKLEPAIQNAY